MTNEQTLSAPFRKKSLGGVSVLNALSLEDTIKNDIKAILNMERKPRHLKLFYYFLFCYKKAHPYLLNKHKEQSANNPTTSTIGGTLRSPNVGLIKNKLKIKGDDYSPWFNAFCEFFYNGAYSYTSGKQRRLKSWTPKAHQLFNNWTYLDIPPEIERLFYTNTRDISSNLLTTTDTETIGGTLRSPVRPFYHNTLSSPNRWYHPLQNLTTKQKKAVFKGHVNVDIVSCYPSIWWYELGGKDCDLDNAWLMHPDHKEEFYKKLMTDFKLSTKQEAKDLRVTLTADYKNKHRISSDVQWFDDLHNRIIDDAYRWAKSVNLVKPSVHKVFSWFEWKIIERMLRAGDEVLLMHDGIVFKEVDIKRLREEAKPYKIDVERW